MTFPPIVTAEEEAREALLLNRYPECADLLRRLLYRIDEIQRKNRSLETAVRLYTGLTLAPDTGVPAYTPGDASPARLPGDHI